MAYDRHTLVLPSPGQPDSSSRQPGDRPRTSSASFVTISESKLVLPDDRRGPVRVLSRRLEAFCVGMGAVADGGTDEVGRSEPARSGSA